ncbi:MAG: dTMP kinase [Betaproteobacteria bacterium]
MRGKFITLEGIDGAGKSTHAPYVRDLVALRSGAGAVITREPGGTPLGERLREMLLHETMMPDTEAMLMFAARREHLERVIWPALDNGEWVISDRFTDATIAYQGGGRGIAPARLAQLEAWTHPGFQPDLTLLFDVPVEVGATRVGHHRSLDKFEREARAFHERVRAAYLARAAADSARFRIIDSTQPVASVRAALERIVGTL